MSIKTIKPHLLVLGVAIVLTTILTWPFALNMGSYFSDNGDYPFNVAQLWYNQDSLITGRIFSPKDYWHGYQFYPQPYSFAFANNALVPSLVFAPMYWISGNIVLAGNFYTFLTFVLSFMAAFYTIRYFMGDRGDKGNKGDLVVIAASMAGAFIFTFNANTMVRFPQHLDVLGKYFLPLVFLFAFQFFEKPTLKKGLLLSLFFTLNALTNNYYGIFTTILLPVLVLPFLISHLRKGDFGYLGKLGKYGLVGLVFLPILLYFYLPYLDFSQKEGVTRTLGDTVFFSARVNDWFGSSPDNFLYGGWMKAIDPFREPKDGRGILNYEEHSLFLGFGALALFFIGLVKGDWGDRGNMGNRGRWYFFMLLVIPFILMLGPFFNGEEDGLPLPFYFLYEWIPVLRGIRSPARFEFVMFIPFALIASFGALWLSRKVRGIWVIWVIGGLLILENLTPKDFSLRSEVLDKMESVDRSQLAVLKGKVTLHLPIYDTADADNFGNNSGYTNWVTKTGERIVNGNTSYLPADQLMFLSDIKSNGLNEKNILKLKALRVEYVIFHKDEVEIVDLAKTNLNPKICSFPGDFDIQFGKAAPGGIIDEGSKPTYAVGIRNKSDCFLPGIYGDRYRIIDVELDGVSKKAHLRMPIIIGPGEQMVLSEIERSLRIE